MRAKSLGIPTVIVTISADGGKTLLPECRPRLARSEVDAHVEALVAVLDNAGTYEEYLNHMGWLCSHKGYLSAADCRRVNGARARVNQLEGLIRDPYEDLEADPFFDERDVID